MISSELKNLEKDQSKLKIIIKREIMKTGVEIKEIKTKRKEKEKEKID